MEYTKKEQLFKKGEKIFPVDFSGFLNKSCKGHHPLHFNEEEIKERLRKGEPLVVVSEPYLVEHRGLFDNEYFIDVKFENSDELYSIMNSKCNVFSSYFGYLGFIEDCEECSYFGY